MIRRKNIIVTFHQVKDHIWFESTIKFLTKNFKIVSADDLYSIMKSGKQFRNVVHITIDDGHCSFYNTIFPILKKYNVPATLFVSPKICKEQKNFWFQMDKNLNQDKMIQIISEEMKIPSSKFDGIPYHPVLKCLSLSRILRILERYYIATGKTPIPPQNISINQLIEVDRTGLVTIGAHTMDHPILSNESDLTAKKEIESSISELQTILGHTIDYFAYPNGQPDLDFGQREIDLLRNKNIKLAFSGKFQSFNIRSEQYSMPRMGFSRGSTITIKIKIFLGIIWPYLKALRIQPEEKLRKGITKLITEE